MTKKLQSLDGNAVPSNGHRWRLTCYPIDIPMTTPHWRNTARRGSMSQAIKRLGWTRKKSREGRRNAMRRNGLLDEKRPTSFRLKRWYVLMSAAPTWLEHPCLPMRQKENGGGAARVVDKNTTLIVARSLEGIGATLILEGSTNTTAFEVYVEQVLAPSLHAGQIVVMDNLQAHKIARVRLAIEAKGCQFFFLPGSSPDLSPPLKKPSDTAQNSLTTEPVPEPETLWKKPLARHSSRSPLKMRKVGSSIADISPHMKGRGR